MSSTSPEPTPSVPVSPRPSRRRNPALYALIGVIALVGVAALVLNGCQSYYLNLSPSVQSQGSVILAVNHADYRDSESPVISITNHLQATIYFLHESDTCGWYLPDQVQGTDKTWSSADEPDVCQAPCNPMGTADPGYSWIALAPGKTVSEQALPLNPNLYRLVLVYTTDDSQEAMPPAFDVNAQDLRAAISPAFSVVTTPSFRVDHNLLHAAQFPCA